MGEQAVALAKAVNYDSAPARSSSSPARTSQFYFLEMNTRLQVEHPVTEMITGIDLVEQMIRVAAGEKLRSAQEDVKLNGWAVESRSLCRGPVPQLPALDRPLVTYRPPARARTATPPCATTPASFEGGEISIYYDPMIAKLVTHGRRRARRRSRRRRDALDAFAIDGIRHNIPFLVGADAASALARAISRPASSPRNIPEGFSPRAAGGRDRAGVMAASRSPATTV
jgi:propionyl-CoA carboxylase alpha chain